MKRSKRFEDIFAECLGLVLAGDETIDGCLRRFPEHAGELRPLLEMALAAKRATAVEPSAEFRERARQQLYDALRAQPVKAKRLTGFAWSWNWPALGGRWAAALAAIVALVLVSGGTVAAAGRSMPGQPLYPVKQATEQVRIALTPSALGKAELYAQLADRRVTEIVYLADRDDPERLKQVTETLDTFLDRISELTGAAGPAPSYELAAPATTTTIAVPTTAPAPASLPPAATVTPPEQKSGAGAAGSMRAADSNTYGAASTPRDKLASLLIAQSANNPARLKAALATASPEVRLALLKAIAVSETGYERALQSLEGQ